MLGVSALEKVETESPVGSFRLDIRATALDAEGQQIAVPIENQYGGSNHDHLGKLITYTAQAATSAERVLGVWIVETARDEHLAAVNFLNEISPSRIGWVLAEVRFLLGPEKSYYVQFEARSRPNAVLASAPRQSSNPANEQANRLYIDAVLTQAAPALEALGCGAPRSHGHSRRIALPADLAVAQYSEIRVMASQTYTRLTLVARGPSQERAENEAILDVLQERYQSALSATLPPGTGAQWHAGIANDVIDYASLTLTNGGYREGDATQASMWVIECVEAWLNALRTHPITDREIATALASFSDHEEPTVSQPLAASTDSDEHTADRRPV
jgi:hypothetical protein